MDSLYIDNAPFNFNHSENTLVFMRENSGEPLLEFKPNGEIVYQGRVLATDKEIIDGFKAVLFECRCPKCKELK